MMRGFFVFFTPQAVSAQSIATTDFLQDTDENNGTSPQSALGNISDFTWRQITGVNYTIRYDTISVSTNAQNRMPFYMVPPSICGKVLVQTMFLGYELKTAPQKPKSQLLGWVKHITTTSPFIFMALNAWREDLQAYQDAGSNLDPEQRTVATILATRGINAVNSPNVPVAVAIWTAMAVQNPASALHLRPKYGTLPFRDFPVHPFAPLG